MPIDSTAELLFKVNANSDDAESNIARFRTLLGKDLAGMGAEFEAWSGKILGEIATVQGAMIAGGALLGAGLVAAGAFAVDAAHKYASYVEEVARGTKTTGLSMEAMSGLKFAADQTNTSYDSLVTGLTRFGSTIDKANGNATVFDKTFGRLKISHADVAAGEQNMLPLLMKVADGFQGLGSQVERTALAREMFSRGGAELVVLLSQGSAGIQKFIDRAGEMGLLLGNEDKLNMLKYKASLKEIKELHEALDVTVGRTMLPIIKYWEEMKASVLQTVFSVGILKGVLAAVTNPMEFLTAVSLNMGKLDAEITKTAATMGRVGDKGLEAGKKVKEANAEWQGLSDLLEKVKERTEDLTSIDAKQAQELEKLGIEVEKATKKYEELKAAGKLSPEDAKAQAAALAQWNDAVGALIVHYEALVAAKNKAAGEKLDDETAAQAEQTYRVKSAAWDREINKQAETLEKEAALGDANWPKLIAKWQAGHAKLDREKAAADEAATAELEKRIAAQGEKTAAGEVAAWNAEMDAQRREYAKKAAYEGEYDAQVERERAAGLERIARTQQAAFDTEIAGLARQLQQVQASHQTAEERIAAQYAVDVEKFTAAEEKKRLAAATSDAQRTVIAAQYAAIRAALFTKEGTDLQALKNSQGWRGVFGADFAAMIRGNEALTREWATSTNQSLMMVRVAMEGLKEMGQQAFNQLSQGMGANIAHAVIYQESIGKAMKAALSATLEMVAAESIVHAIRSTAMGFEALAAHDYPAATSAFTAAAVWGSVGAAAAVAGRAITPASASAAASGSAAAGASAGSASAGASGAAGTPAVNVQVNMYGSLIRSTDSLIDAINDAVERGKTLTATNTTTGKTVYR
jgi:hypothetical protein